MWRKTSFPFARSKERRHRQRFRQIVKRIRQWLTPAAASHQQQQCQQSPTWILLPYPLPSTALHSGSSINFILSLRPWCHTWSDGYCLFAQTHLSGELCGPLHVTSGRSAFEILGIKLLFRRCVVVKLHLRSANARELLTQKGRIGRYPSTPMTGGYEFIEWYCIMLYNLRNVTFNTDWKCSHVWLGVFGLVIRFSTQATNRMYPFNPSTP